MGLKQKVLERQLKKMDRMIANLPEKDRKHIENIIAQTQEHTNKDEEE